MPVLDNPRHERFCQLAATLREDGSVRADYEAYQIAYGCDVEQAKSNAWRLKEDEGVKLRILELKQPISDKLALTRDESLQFLANVVRTPVGAVTEDHVLAQSIKRSPEGVVTEIKMPGKLEALKLNAQLQGWLTEGQPQSLLINLNLLGTELPAQVVELEQDSNNMIQQ